ncbi:hypothetical protein K2173_024085 [Erythroxylum novogranatense]|uniref:MADS-box domain-containing protein n=1 Tax=Erythroxylum novogranatense TaxID=1862640 RepID=A0AAV8UBX3_9ROSI|nr:hypothetical protein K2173_024085 [Erythroxylum novogranatense]
MTRKKVKLVWIGNDAARRASLKKRRSGLLKKVSELTILCGVQAFVVIYGPDDPEPTIWPSRAELKQLMLKFQGMPEIDRCKKMMNQESYLRERVGKVQDQCRKHQRKNKEMEMAYLMHQIQQGKGFDGFGLNELHGLVWLVQEKMKEIRRRVEFFQQVTPLPGKLHHHQEGPNDVAVAPGPTDPLLCDQYWVNSSCENHLFGGCGGGKTENMGYSIGSSSKSNGGFEMNFLHGNIGSSNNVVGPGLVHHHHDYLRESNFDPGLPVGNYVGGSATGIVPIPRNNYGSNSGRGNSGFAGVFGGGTPGDTTRTQFY